MPNGKIPRGGLAWDWTHDRDRSRSSGTTLPDVLIREGFGSLIGLTPLQKSTGGKERLGRISHRGDRTLRRLLVSGASAVVRWAQRKGAPDGSRLARMLMRKPPMLVIVALANKMAGIAWALMAKGGVCQAPATVA